MLSHGTEPMNHFSLPGYEKPTESRCTVPSEPPHNRRSRMIVAFGLTLSLVVLIANVRPASAQAAVDADDVPPAAQAGGADDLAQAAPATNGMSSAPDPLSGKWKFTVGGGAINGARYPGSRYDFTRGLPLVSISYGRYFFGADPGGGTPAGVGAYLLRTEHWAIGLDIGGDSRKPRRATDDPILRGWGDIPGTARAGMFASYTQDWLSVRGSISDAVAHHEGVLASLAVEAKYRATQRLTLSIGPEVTWANNQYSQTFFGITPAQSEIAGIAPYRAKSGINTVAGSAGATYMLTDHWSLRARASY